MTILVKVCGLRTPQEVAWAAAADACGVVVESPSSQRSLTVDAAARLLGSVPGSARRVAVTTCTDLARLVEIAEELPIDALQPQALSAMSSLQGLRRNLPSRIGLIPVLRVPTAATYLAPSAVASLADLDTVAAMATWVLLDTHSATAGGGGGIVGDWVAASRVREGLSRVPVFLAGGLGPDNVAQAIAQVRPSGVDASSGLERNGGKDQMLIDAFFEAARSVAHR